MEEAEEIGPSALEKTARLVGLVGLFPFVLLSVWLFSIPPDHVWRSGTILMLAAYGAVVLAFLGGARFGMAMRRPDDAGEVVIAIVPPLIGWLSIALAPPHTFAALAVAFAAQGASDAFAAHDARAPAWYGRLRIMLTVAIVATLLLAFAATA